MIQLIKMIEIFLVLLLSEATSSVTFSLSYFLTATSGLPNMPQFVGVVMLNDEVVGYYDSNKDMAHAKQAWVQDYLSKDPEHLIWHAIQCRHHRRDFNADIYNLKNHFNQTRDTHVLQRVSGCEMDNDTGAVRGFNRYGYNGEDFILLDLDAETWIAPQQAAHLTKHRWDAETATIQYMKHFYLNDCRDRINSYMRFAGEFLNRIVHPKVALLQKTPQSPVCCHATGFYPDHGAKMFWRRDGKKVQELLRDSGEILPNHDGTFQKTVCLNVSAIPEDRWNQYQCVFDFEARNQDEMVAILDKAVIETNYLSQGVPLLAPVVGGTVVVLLLVAVAIALYSFWKRECKGSRLGG
ncbi:major histocompatibility complex class I-related gene protein-like [Hippocampus zosterae]|uniref:major histocompatibility complex class I-related gene protein-like n=1 Tax=Hippocampus zosterae TaxID=109293 RepID=UPI00223E7492|nr:major histocompatibility complex class I-related gene protein-like [Hippocampus zosterae]